MGAAYTTNSVQVSTPFPWISFEAALHQVQPKAQAQGMWCAGIGAPGPTRAARELWWQSRAQEESRRLRADAACRSPTGQVAVRQHWRLHAGRGARPAEARADEGARERPFRRRLAQEHLVGDGPGLAARSAVGECRKRRVPRLPDAGQ